MCIVIIILDISVLYSYCKYLCAGGETKLCRITTQQRVGKLKLTNVNPSGQSDYVRSCRRDIHSELD